MLDLSTIANNAFGLLIGAGIVAAWFRAREGRIASLEADLLKLRDRTVGELQARVERHIEADRSQEFAAKMETVIAQNNEIMVELKKLNRDSAVHSSSQARTEKSLEDLWNKFDNCRQNHGGKA